VIGRCSTKSGLPPRSCCYASIYNSVVQISNKVSASGARCYLKAKPASVAQSKKGRCVNLHPRRDIHASDQRSSLAQASLFGSPGNNFKWVSKLKGFCSEISSRSLHNLDCQVQDGIDRKPIGRSLIVFTAPCVAVLMVVRRLSPGARARFSAKVPHGSLCHASLFAINLAMRSMISVLATA
jgi:hypothetical protein